MNRLRGIPIKNWKLALAVVTSVLLLMPLGVVEAQSIDVSHQSHHSLHSDVAACSAACATASSSRTNEQPLRNTDFKSELLKRQDKPTEFDSTENEVQEEFQEPELTYLPDKSLEYRLNTALLL